MRRYYDYALNPQLNAKRAFESLEATKLRIKSMSPSKQTFEDFEDVWKASILHTAFSILYTIRGDTVLIIDIRDQRGHRSAEAIFKSATEIRRL